VEQRREPMNKNRMRGMRCRTSWHVTTKSVSIKGTGCKSGGCALKAVELTSGDLSFVSESRLRIERFGADRAAGVSRGRIRHASAEGPNGSRKGLMGAASKRRDS
jgi:hypothetical protein